MDQGSPGKEAFRKDGYVLFRSFFTPLELQSIRGPVKDANALWLEEHPEAMSKGVVNSAYLTSPRFCPAPEYRRAIFRFIALDRMVHLAAGFMDATPYFMNTQAFFNPLPGTRQPYWHRDIQYTGMPEEEQKEKILKDHVLHFRIPLAADPGLEFIPGSHKRWDTQEERAVRLNLDGRKQHHDLPGSVRVPHGPGDLLVFSAHLIHKGVYGGDRLSFDVLYASFKAMAADASANGHFPDTALQAETPNPFLFELQ